jgi:hypothetical protein
MSDVRQEVRRLDDEGNEIRTVVAKNYQMQLDERGIPVDLNEDGTSAPHCPFNPCALCTGFSMCTNKDGTRQTSWEWCQELDTCAATVDWEKIYGDSR